MSTVTRFQDLIAWQKARELTKQVYQLTQSERFARDFGLSGQIQRAAVSVMSNIAEGFERSGKLELLHFLSLARASCAEVRSQLYVALDIGYIDEPTFRGVMKLAEEVSRLVSGFRISVEKHHKSRTGSNSAL